MSGGSGDGSFVDGFVMASLTVSIGAMAIVGALEDGIAGDWSILAAKAVQKTIRTKRLVSNGLVLQERFLRMTKRV